MRFGQVALLLAENKEEVMMGLYVNPDGIHKRSHNCNRNPGTLTLTLIPTLALILSLAPTLTLNLALIIYNPDPYTHLQPVDSIRGSRPLTPVVYY